MSKAGSLSVDVAPFIALLDSPYTLDRNKSLMVLSEVAKKNKYQQEILQKSQDKLIQLLALKQPNNHEFAYKILKEISKKDFNEYDTEAWRLWLLTQKGQIG
jgi:hypothetical protein